MATEEPADVAVAAASATVIRPGDTVLLALARDDYPPDALCRIQDQLTEHFPKVNFVVVCGASVAITREEPTDG